MEIYGMNISEIIKSGSIDAYIPELLALQGVIQDKEHHPEGDAFIHTLYVMDAMEDIIARDNIPETYHAILINAAMCHDLGKVTTTEIHADGRITAYGHPKAGVEPTITLLRRLGVPEYEITAIVPLVKEHMAWVSYFTPEITDRAIRRLARRLKPANYELWALIVEADMSGRPPKAGGLPDRAREILDLARELGVNEGIKD